MLIKLLSLATVALVLNCSKKEETTPKENTTIENLSNKEFSGTTTTGTQAAADSELVGGTIDAQVDEAISSLVEDNEGTSTTLALSSSSSPTVIEFSRSCAVDGDSAVVNIERNFSLSRSFVGHHATREISITANDQITRTWSKEGSSVPCNSTNKFVGLKFSEMEGVNLKAEFTRLKERKATITITKSGKTLQNDIYIKAEGSRTIAFDAITKTDDETTISKTVSHEVKRTMDLPNKDGDVKKVEFTSKTIADAPLKTEVVRKSLDGEVVSRMIKSGKVVATYADNSSLTSTFENVKYIAGTCMPASGKITGEVTLANETAASLTYTISFSASTATIEFSNGDSLDYAPKGCDLEVDVLKDGVEKEPEAS